jgi:hypothetical protein
MPSIVNPDRVRFAMMARQANLRLSVYLIPAAPTINRHIAAKTLNDHNLSGGEFRGRDKDLPNV